jgi:hypothetical protein
MMRDNLESINKGIKELDIALSGTLYGNGGSQQLLGSALQRQTIFLRHLMRIQ